MAIENHPRDMTADELRGIARKLRTYAYIYTGDKEAMKMAARCDEMAALLDTANALLAAHHDT
jgi:hypothetical protein